MSQPEVRWIADNQTLASVLAQLFGSPLYLDTEFIRRTTYWPRPALIQMLAKKTVWLIDPLHINNWEPLARLLADTTSEKVLHAGTEDLQLLWRLCATFPDPYYDTQIAQALLSEQTSMGYRNLVKALLGVELGDSRNTQTSNWLQRPLAESQIDYAIKDVVYLEQIHHKQLSLFTKHPDRLEWLRQVCQQQTEQIKMDCTSDGSLAYLGIKGVSRISSMGILKRLQKLAQWRERQARQRDIVRNRLLSDKDMHILAQQEKISAGNWQKISTGRLFCRERDTAAIQALLGQAENLPELQRPEPIMPKSYNRLYHRMDEVKKRIAKDLGISDQLLVNKKNLQLFLLSGGTRRFGGWRDLLLREPMMNLIQQSLPEFDQKASDSEYN